MSHAKSSLLQAVEIAASSKAILLHVQATNHLDFTHKQDEFCGSSLFRSQIGITPMFLALSMELALKAWIVRDGTRSAVPKSHDLSKLFAYISLNTRERLKARYDRDIVPRHPDFFYLDAGLERTLENARDAFVKWRYMHELKIARFDVSVFTETVEMILAEFESGIVVRNYRPPFARL